MNTNLYICVFHFRMRSAMITPHSYPVKKFAVAYNGKYNNKPIKCVDKKEKIKIKINDKEIEFVFNNNIEKIPYSINEICTYELKLYDAMESWGVIVSESPIQIELFVSNYKLESDGLYYNIDDMQKRDSWLAQFKN